MGKQNIVSFLLGVVYSFKALAKAKKEILLRFQKCTTVCMGNIIYQQHDIFYQFILRGHAYLHCYKIWT